MQCLYYQAISFDQTLTIFHSISLTHSVLLCGVGATRKNVLHENTTLEKDKRKRALNKANSDLDSLE